MGELRHIARDLGCPKVEIDVLDRWSLVGYIERHGKIEYVDVLRLKKRNQRARGDSGLLEPYEPIVLRAVRATEPNHAGAVHFVHQSRFEHGVPTWRFGEAGIEQSDAAFA